MSSEERSIRRVAMLGNHLPRQCGIATFTTDLSDAIASAWSELDCFVLAMNDGRHQHAYPPRVRFELADNDPGAYTRAADFLNVNAVDVISVQHEYGIFGGKAGSHLLPLLRELGIGLVPYSPLGRGILTGAITDESDLDESDTRLSERFPRLNGEGLRANLRLVGEIRTIAERLGCTPGQLALAWVLAQGDDVVPIPGTRRVRYLEENAGAAEVVLSAEDLRALTDAVPRDALTTLIIESDGDVPAAFVNLLDHAARDVHDGLAGIGGLTTRGYGSLLLAAPVSPRAVSHSELAAAWAEVASHQKPEDAR